MEVYKYEMETKIELANVHNQKKVVAHNFKLWMIVSTFLLVISVKVRLLIELENAAFYKYKCCVSFYSFGA